MQQSAARVAISDEQVFYKLFKASPIGIALHHPAGRLVFANPVLCSMLGFSEEELRGRRFSELSPAEDTQEDCALLQQLWTGSIASYSLEKRFFRRGGSLIWGHLSVALLGDNTPPLVVTIVEDITERIKTQEELLHSEATLQRLAGGLIQAQEEERSRIARELHDDITQRLALLAANLECLEQDLPISQQHLNRGLAEIRREVQELGSDVQDLSHRLHSSRLEVLGLAQAARSFCEDYSLRHRVKIDFCAKNIPKGLSNDVSLCLFRVLQEASQNATKHSGSQHFQVSLTGEAGEIHLKVHDSGIGFNPEDAIKGHGLGFTSMSERLKLVKGTLSVDSRPQRGTTIHARVPLSAPFGTPAKGSDRVSVGIIRNTA
jgi:PAS domain S-box-containing protein